MTQVEDGLGTSVGHEAAGTERRRVRRRRPAEKSRPRVLLTIGLVLIVAGVAVLAWVAWQFWGTNWASDRKQDDVVAALEDGWADGNDAVRTDFGRASAIVHIPRFGKDYAVPVLEGSSDEVLAAGIGHLEDTADPGKIGNYVIAGHRVTHGEPFADLPELQPGDKVYVETRTATYTYVLDTGGTDLIVPFTETWVTAPEPVNPDGGVQPPPDAGNRLITLVTCSEIFHTDNRSVVFGHLVEVDRTAG